MLDSPTPSARPQRGWRATKSFWIVAAIVLLLVLSAAASGGFGSVLALLGIVALFTGLYALLFKRRSWVGIPHRKSAAIVAASGVIATFVGGGIGAATAAPSGSHVVAVAESSPSVTATQTETAESSPSATATPTETSPANAACTTATESRTYRDEIFTCTVASDNKLVWLSEADSKNLATQKQEAAKAAEAKAAADKAAAAKAAADKAAAAKAAEAKVAAEKVAADKAAAERLAGEKVAAEQAAAAEAARQAAQVPAPAAPVAGYVHPGAFCSGGTGVSKTGRAMVCAPATDGRLRWRSA
ncbi:hypothetical protein ACFRJ8_20905 [Arthrobacter sp. NPDC056886]|uniref:hypothetical protein n=1 Tax=Arthrobacter sp. NPDC056886 TaxID=3345960 RepID=UPI003672C960